MIRRPTWVLLGLLIAVVGFTWFFQRNQAKKAENLPTATPTIAKAKLFDVDSSQASEIKISGVDGNEIVFSRDKTTSQWIMSGIPEEQSDTVQIDSMVSNLFSLQVDERLTQTPPLDSIGLSSPGSTIVITRQGGTQLVTEVGAPTAIGNGYYVRVDNGAVMIVNKAMLDNILNMLTTPPILVVATPEETIPTPSTGGSTPTP